MKLREDSSSVISSLPTGSSCGPSPLFLVWDENSVIPETGTFAAQILSTRPLWEPSCTTCLSPNVPEASSMFFGSQQHRAPLPFLDRPSHAAHARGQIILINDPARGVMLRQSVVELHQTRWTSTASRCDFAIHDQTLDLLQVLQTQRMATDDLQSSQTQPTEQRAQLRAQEAQSRKLASLPPARTMR